MKIRKDKKMWYDRKDITKEDADKENRRMFALEDRIDDEFDEARIDDAYNRIDWSFLDSTKKDDGKSK